VSSRSSDDDSTIPKLHTVLKTKYKLFAYTMLLSTGSLGAHIFTVFMTPSGKVIYDGLHATFERYTKTNCEATVNIIWFLKA